MVEGGMEVEVATRVEEVDTKVADTKEEEVDMAGEAGTVAVKVSQPNLTCSC
jgi:hypothetical protein